MWSYISTAQVAKIFFWKSIFLFKCFFGNRNVFPLYIMKQYVQKLNRKQKKHQFEFGYIFDKFFSELNPISLYDSIELPITIETKNILSYTNATVILLY